MVCYFWHHVKAALSVFPKLYSFQRRAHIFYIKCFNGVLDYQNSGSENDAWAFRG